MLNLYDLLAPARYTMFSHALPSNPGFGPETKVHPAMLVNHSCDTRIAELGRATTSLLFAFEFIDLNNGTSDCGTWYLTFRNFALHLWMQRHNNGIST